MKQLLTQTFLREQGLSALCGKFAIKAVWHGEFPHLVLLKYDQLNSPMAEMMVQECRGLIVDEANHWASVCVPFFKFFNVGEGNAAPIDWNTARVYEKLDGSLMSLFFYGGEWRVSSSGKPDAAGMMGNLGISMAECFWRVWHELGYVMPSDRWRGATFMFEFMTPWNRVVVQHEKPRIVFIGCRDAEFQEFAPEEFAHWGWEIVKSFPINSLTGVLEAAQELKPLHNEGYVVCDADFKRVKIKSPAYVALHHLRDSFCRRRLVEIIQHNESDEFLAYFPAFEPEYRDVKIRFDALVEATAIAWSALPQFAPHEQREFALAVKETPYAAVFFALRAGKTKSPKDFYAGMVPERLLKLLDAP
ncbi:hypothetical protein IAD21_01441 [Abditibacteriota bacterium]|nr:hypothetical protein IAD21_01441 [Abditibacteriota bacterium]